ncbi:hypothetical protein AB1Y20_016323 [Prymnesium parvum]|uniref:Arsenate reductase n=1 Tax=Prymnesium parvum TaxID=97485 RepID=A0AB34IDN2_PRYPA
MRGLLLHNAACSKSRTALQLLKEARAEFDVREYLGQPLSLSELRQLRSSLRESPSKWCRPDAPLASDGEQSEEAVLRAIAERPELLERPIFMRGPWAVVGRPPELVLALVGADLPASAEEAGEWREVYRVDTHGGSARVALVPGEQGAHLLAAHYEAKGHHQGYFVRSWPLQHPVSIRSEV